MKQEIRILPFGGCGEIGMNMTLFNVNGLFYMVDCGVLFPEPHNVGVDYVVPSIKTLLDAQIKIQAWLITHGHEDHIGGLPFIYPRLKAPLYSTAYTLELIKAKFADRKIRDYSFHTWKEYETVSLPGLKVTPFTVNHSIPAATGLLMETESLNLLHSGDFRIDRHPPEGSMTQDNIQKVIKGKKIHLYMADSTNSFSEGADHSEDELLPNFVKLFKAGRGKVIVTCFASNVWRMQTILKAAHEANRKVFFIGRSVEKMSELARQTGVIDTEIYRSTVIDELQMEKIEPSNLVILCTGSQGEPSSALFRLIVDAHQKIQIDANDTVIFSSRPIPGNERKIGSLMNQIIKKGAKVYTGKDLLIHVSGHAYQEDLITLFQTIKPAFFMPLHGEYRHLKQHIDVAEKGGIPFEKCVLAENGDIVNLSEEECFVEDQVHIPRDYICQNQLYPSNDMVYKTREAISKTGLMSITFVFHQKTKKLRSKPLVRQYGLFNQNFDIEKITQIFNYSTQESEDPNQKKASDLPLKKWEQNLTHSLSKYLSKSFGAPIYITVQLIPLYDQKQKTDQKGRFKPNGNLKKDQNFFKADPEL